MIRPSYSSRGFICIPILVLFLLLVGEIAADTDTIKEQQQIKQNSKLKIVMFPAFFYKEKTGFAGGIASNVIYRNRPGKPYSSIDFLSFYSQKGQYSINLKTEVCLAEDTYRISGKILYRYTSNDFYGVGNNASKEDKGLYTASLFGFHIRAQKRLRPNLYLGPQYQLVYDHLIDTDGDIFTESEILKAGNTGLASGIGIYVAWDSRDLYSYPTQGIYSQASIISFQSFLGSSNSFTSYATDFCSYHPIYASHVLALQGYLGAISGNPPFHMMNSLDDLLRGFGDNRFVDKNVIAFQAEYRIPLFWRLGAVIFTGAGEVFDNLGSLTLGGFKPSAGLGLRMAIIRDPKQNLRIDWAKSIDDSTLEFGFKEAF